MSVDNVTQLAHTADLAHSRLRKALARIEADYWAAADAIHEAHVEEAWTHDDGEHEPRYRTIMQERGFTSIFPAYIFDEFGLAAGIAGHLDRAGRLRAGINPLTRVSGLDWDRFTLKAVRPVNAGVLNQFEAEDIAAALVDAQRLAERDAERHPRPGHQSELTPVRPLHVRSALVERGMIPRHAVDVDEGNVKERQAMRIERAASRIGDDLDLLLAANQRRAVLNILTSTIRKLSDQPKAIATLRELLEELP